MDDCEQIRMLFARYSVAADELDLDAFVACFADYAVFEFVNEGRKFSGTREIYEMLAGSSLQGLHVVTDLILDVQDDWAHASSRLMEWNRETGLLFRVGKYSDTLSKCDGEWRFTHRQITYTIGALHR